MGLSGENRWAVRRIALAVILVAATVVIALPTSAATPRWKLVPSPSPPGPPNGTLAGVACWDASNCLAIGANSGLLGGESAAGATPKLQGWNGATRTPSTQLPGRYRRWNGTGCADPAQCLRQRPATARNGQVIIIVSGPEPLLERWNGSTWSIVPGPQPPTNTAIDLVAMSCPAANDCFAVGDQATGQSGHFVVRPAAMHWNGSTWSFLPVPKPAASPLSELNGVSCASPTNCVAVGDLLTGDLNTGNVTTHALIERWNGTSWSLDSFPKPAGSSQEFLSGVSCADASNCLAVGAYLAGNVSGPLVERASGTTWSTVTALVPPGDDGTSLIDVACTSATSCVTVGDAAVANGIVPVAERWNGTMFSIDTLPPVTADLAGLFAIACTSASDCSAVGGTLSIQSGQPVAAPLREHWNGSSWSIASGPAATPLSEVDDVACTSATACFAVGPSALVEQWNGTTWSLSPLDAHSSQSQLVDIACGDGAHCVGVGLYSNDAGPQVLVERRNGPHWQIESAPNRAGATNAALIAVDCVNAGDCTAVGGAGDASGPRVSLIEHWDGTSWSVVPSPSPPGADFVELLDVSCSTATTCNALGVKDRNGAESPFGVHWDGQRWSLTPIPVSDFAELVTLPSLSCSRPDSCFAVGTYILVTGDRHVIQRAFLLHWDGHRWLRRAGAKLPGGAAAQLNTVSCSDRDHCLAVGAQFQANGAGGILNERWDGSRWKVVDDGDRSLSFLPTGLACRATVSCYAVGTTFSIDAPGAAVAHWNGRTWRAVSSATLRRATFSGLSGVDCPTNTACYAAGFFDTTRGSFTLVMVGT